MENRDREDAEELSGSGGGSMIQGLRPYATYKESGVPGLGKIPSHWTMWRLKNILSERDSRSTDGSEQLLRVSQYTGVTQRKSAQPGGEPDTRAESLIGYRIVAPMDLAVNIMLAWNGSLGVSRFAGIVSPAYGVYRFRGDAAPWYFHYLLRSPGFKEYIKSASTGVVESRLRLYTEDLFRLSVCVPPAAEQAAIARFLDYADRCIWRYIRAKQKLIKLLEELKQAIVHRAVTRGLNPDVRVSPSGVEGMEHIPEHWGVAQLRRLVQRGRRITYGIVQPGEPDASGRFMIRGQDYSAGWASPETVFRVSERVEAPYKRSRLMSGDIVFTIVGAGVGNVAIVPPDFDGANITQTTARIAIDPTKADAEFVAAALEGPVGKRSVERYVKGAAQPGLNLEHLKVFVVPVPPISEQQTITSELRRRSQIVQEAIQATRREIVLLQELRVRLIADVVTGKLDVHSVSAGLPRGSDDIGETGSDNFLSDGGDGDEDAPALEEAEA